MNPTNWFEINNAEVVDTPALLIHKNAVAENIQAMVNITGSPSRLMPHVKTHKMPKIVKMQLEAGIDQFKCATIAEAEMLAEAGAKKVLLAYQLTAVKAHRFIALIKKFPEIHFASLIDNAASAFMLDDLYSKENLVGNVYIDVDAGMHRTGISAGEELLELYNLFGKLAKLQCEGLHVYDGHIRDSNFAIRQEKVASAWLPVNKVIREIADSASRTPKIIAGGTPTFTVHALNPEEICSPGTCLLWDKGYNDLLTEQPFKFAAVLMTRVISKPGKGLITTDLGHKSVAAENDLSKRIYFLNLTDYTIVSQSEEHLVVEVPNAEEINIGDVLYGIPHHICPTVALYDQANIVENGFVTDHWPVVARDRSISL
jgi:D-serine deaminase-like pyridoxal phosphate-dependent protein